MPLDHDKPHFVTWHKWGFLFWFLVSCFLALNYYQRYHCEQIEGFDQKICEAAPAKLTADEQKKLQGSDPEHGIGHGILTFWNQYVLDGPRKAWQALSWLPSVIPLSKTPVSGHHAPPEGHPVPTTAAALLKMSLVIALSFLWFYAFSAAAETKVWHEQSQKRPVDLSRPARFTLGLPLGGRDAYWVAMGVFRVFPVFPSALFVISMQYAYEPAVFMMALVAIFVAAEHYSGLHETEHKLNRQTVELGETLKDGTQNLQAKTRKLTRTLARRTRLLNRSLQNNTAELSKALKERTEDLKKGTDRLESAMGLILDADGLQQWRSNVYSLYGQAKQRIDAVYRHFDIDSEWWTVPEGAPNPWAQYQVDCKSRTSLWAALCNTSAKVQFIAEVPFTSIPRPIDSTWRRQVVPETSDEKGARARREFFRSLLGLTWNIVVFCHAYAEKKQLRSGAEDKSSDPPKSSRAPQPLRVKLTRAPFWMHVVDERVFQLIERSPVSHSTVRELTLNIHEPHPLSDWARDNVRWAAQRGGRAEEFVITVLRYAALKLGCSENEPLELAPVLNALGMSDWLNGYKEEFYIFDQTHPDRPADPRFGHRIMLTRSAAEERCLAVFQEFLDLECGRGTGTLRSLGEKVL